MSLNATPFAQSFFHGAKANLKTGDLITPWIRLQSSGPATRRLHLSDIYARRGRLGR